MAGEGEPEAKKPRLDGEAAGDAAAAAAAAAAAEALGGADGGGGGGAAAVVDMAEGGEGFALPQDDAETAAALKQVEEVEQELNKVCAGGCGGCMAVLVGGAWMDAATR